MAKIVGHTLTKTLHAECESVCQDSDCQERAQREQASEATIIVALQLLPTSTSVCGLLETLMQVVTVACHEQPRGRKVVAAALAWPLVDVVSRVLPVHGSWCGLSKAWHYVDLESQPPWRKAYLLMHVKTSMEAQSSFCRLQPS